MTTNEAKFSVYDLDANVLARNETLEDAAKTVLANNSHLFEIREAMDGDGNHVGFELWISPISHASPAYKGLNCSDIFSFETDRKAAETEIWNRVLNWSRPFGCEVVKHV